jgi:hypothetical protein
MSTAATPFNGVVVAIQVCFLRLDRLPMLETGEEARRLAEMCLLFLRFCHVFFRAEIDYYMLLFLRFLLRENYGREDVKGVPTSRVLSKFRIDRNWFLL